MATAAKAAPAQAEGLTAGTWRADLDPVALPPTTEFTLGQRRVLQACVQLFADQGFMGSSIRDIAALAGLQSASLYNHFPSKDAMLTSLVLLGHEYHLDQVLSAVLSTSADPRDQLRALTEAHVLVHCTYPRLGLIASRELRFLPAEAVPQVETIRTRSGGITREILRRGEELGVFDVQGRQATVLALASMGVDAARWFPYQTEISAAELCRDYASLSLRMVSA